MTESSSPIGCNGFGALTSLNLPQIKVLKLRISARWRRPESIPGRVVANVLRGALGLVFRKLVCPTEWFDNPCHPCPMYINCEYGRLFNPKPSVLGDQLRSQQDSPRPFVIEPTGLDEYHYQRSERIVFGLMLFGRAIDSLPLFVTTLERLGRDGLGRNRTPFELEEISTVHSRGSELLFGPRQRVLQVPKHFYTNDDFSQPIDKPATSTLDSHELPARLKIEFRSPLLLKYGSYRDESGRTIPAREVRESPSFAVLVRRLRDRLSSLCAFFGHRWEVDFKLLGELADEASTVDSRTVWLTRRRCSTRTGQSHEISGLVGWSIYQFPSYEHLQLFLPLLSIGELIHVGKNAPWGNGGIACKLHDSRGDT